MVIGSFLPWITASTIFGTLGRSGIDGGGDGLISAGLGIAAVAISVALTRNESLLGSRALTAVGVLGATVVILAVNDIASRFESFDLAVPAVGIGLWVVGAGALLTGVTGLEGLRATKAPPEATTQAFATSRQRIRKFFFCEATPTKHLVRIVALFLIIVIVAVVYLAYAALTGSL
jgi:hypothetical protein